jgi:chemotaxis signal transduction protein
VYAQEAPAGAPRPPLARDTPGRPGLDETMADIEDWFLICTAATRLVALPLAHVVEVMRAPRLDKGCAPMLTPLRGELTPVLELGVYLGWTPAGGTTTAVNTSRRLVSVRLQTQAHPVPFAAGLLVDEVIGVRRLDPGSLVSIALPGGAAASIGRFDTGMAQCLDLAGVLTAEALVSGMKESEAWEPAA